MKAYIMTDLEAVAGVVSFESQTYATGKYYEAAKELLTAEVNAAVEALVASDIDEILVVDGHGFGAISYESLHPEAKLLHGRPSAPLKLRQQILAEYDIALMIGQHGMAGVADANMNHTQSSRSIDYYKLNGKLIGEIAQFALHVGAFDIPVIFLSGDDAACRETNELIPSTVTVSVKRGLGRNSAISLSAQKARALIHEGVLEAVCQHREQPKPPLRWDGPYVLEKRFFHTDVADQYLNQPGVERVDGQTIRMRDDRIEDLIYR